MGIIPACAGSTPPLGGRRSDSRDHPRVRGEHPGSGRHGPMNSGSSPRARGAHFPDVVRAQPGRIIPACAGSTRASAARMRSMRDHPRVRGEHWASFSAAFFPWGSSPRARGALVGGRVGGGRPGIIPACAGSTTCPRGRCAARRDHPRVRGEHKVLHPLSLVARGSSPRARGAPAARRVWRGRGGIIPACAGSTTSRSLGISWSWDHPRVRGEHGSDLKTHHEGAGSSPRARGAREPFDLGVAHRGSSPRARGARSGCEAYEAFIGIIPACAGSTARRRMRAAKPGDHPRVRGEHAGTQPHIPSGRGSSPRARGAHLDDRPGRLHPGIIPACAGSTDAATAGTARPRDHPRVRGEHRGRAGRTARAPGSSPRARGARRPR